LQNLQIAHSTICKLLIEPQLGQKEPTPSVSNGTVRNRPLLSQKDRPSMPGPTFCPKRTDPPCQDRPSVPFGTPGTDPLSHLGQLGPTLPTPHPQHSYIGVMLKTPKPFCSSSSISCFPSIKVRGLSLANSNDLLLKRLVVTKTPRTASVSTIDP